MTDMHKPLTYAEARLVQCARPGLYTEAEIAEANDVLQAHLMGAASAARSCGHVEDPDGSIIDVPEPHPSENWKWPSGWFVAPAALLILTGLIAILF